MGQYRSSSSSSSIKPTPPPPAPRQDRPYLQRQGEHTASAAFSHREGNMVTRVAVQNRNTHREVAYLQLGSPAICMRVAVCLHMQANGILFITHTHPDQSPIARGNTL